MQRAADGVIHLIQEILLLPEERRERGQMDPFYSVFYIRQSSFPAAFVSRLDYRDRDGCVVRVTAVCHCVFGRQVTVRRGGCVIKGREAGGMEGGCL